jgi:hypothetical protein
MDYRTDFYAARWHLDVVKRMFGSYDEYGGKRFLVGVVRESAKCAAKLIRAFLIFDETRGGVVTFRDEVGPKYLKRKKVLDLLMILEIEKDEKRARAEFVKKDKVLFEVDGKWKVLMVSRLRELVDSLDEILGAFPTNIKR